MYVCIYVCNVCMYVCNVCMHVCRVGCHVVAGTRQCHGYIVPPSRVEPAAGMAMSPVSHGSGVSPTGSSDPVKGGGSPCCPCLIIINNPQKTLAISAPVLFGKYEHSGDSPSSPGGCPFACFLHGARGIRGQPFVSAPLDPPCFCHLPSANRTAT